jgi:hypothetical protein
VLSSSLQGYRQIVAPLQLAPQAQRGGGRQAAVPLRLFVRMNAGGERRGDWLAATFLPAPAAMCIVLRPAALLFAPAQPRPHVRHLPTGIQAT